MYIYTAVCKWLEESKEYRITFNSCGLRLTPEEAQEWAEEACFRNHHQLIRVEEEVRESKVISEKVVYHPSFPNLYHPSDPSAPKDAECWHFVYLHGKAERDMDDRQQENNWEWSAPDMFVADTPMPPDGHGFVMIYGKPAYAVLAKRGTLPGGRIAYLDDAEALAHVKDPCQWM